MMKRILGALCALTFATAAVGQTSPRFNSIQLLQPGSTGDVSAMSVTPNSGAAAGTLAKTVTTFAPLASPTFTGTVTGGSFAGDASATGVTPNAGAAAGTLARFASDTNTSLGLLQRNVQFDPRSFSGATCNGTGTNDDAGVSAALLALKAAGGGKLYVPGKCVLSSPKTYSGAPIKVDGSGVGVSQLVGSATFGPAGSYILSIDLTGSSDYTAEISNVGFRTAQNEGASALSITAAASGLEHRVFMHDIEMRGTTVGGAGFAYGLNLTNVNGPILDRIVVTGRQSGTGQAGLTNMSVCFNVNNTVTGLTNYIFSKLRCNAAQTAFNFNGYIEGIFCDQCLAVAVNTGFVVRPGQTVPYMGVSQSHVDFFAAAFDIQYMSQGDFVGNLLYHRSDATINGVCYNIALGAGQNRFIGGQCVNVSTATTSLIGFNFSASNNNTVSDMTLSNVNTGVTNTNGSTGNIYRRGQWMNVPTGGGEFGNGGSGTNICIGYNAAC